MRFVATVGSLWFYVAASALIACAASPSAVPPPASTAAASAPVQPPPSASVAPVASALPAPTATESAAPIAPPPAQTSAVANTKSEGSWAPCHQGYKAPGKDVSKDVGAMAKACEKQTKMKVLGKTLAGKQADVDTPQIFPLDAKGGHCYRVYAQAAATIKDLDVFVKDSAGVLVAQDSTDDPSPVVLEDGAVCFTKDDKASVVVSVGMGSGAYALQIWGD